MNTETKLAYISFSKYKDSGFNYHLFDNEPSMRKNLDEDPEFKFLCEVVVPVVSKADVAQLGMSILDKEIADHAVAIAKLEAKKQQFLAIEHDGGES